MKISKFWLDKFFSAPLPTAGVLGDALTFHAFEIDGIEKVGGDEVLDVKVTPNRGHDALSHRGIAKELSAILKLPLAHDPFDNKSDISKKTDAVSVSIDSPLCKRYIAGYVKGVKVGPSPKWLKDRLEAIGQRSINNVVDATNFVMFNTGQPLHAFDAGKLGSLKIGVRLAKDGEAMVALDKKSYTLKDSMLVITAGDKAVGIAGVKGGMPAAIDESTKDIVIESANFDGASVRKTAQALKLRTDASTRFEQGISPELAARGMQGMIEFIAHQIGGEIAGFVDVYPKPQEKQYASVTLEKINKVLGTTLTNADVTDVFTRLGLPYKEEQGVFEVQPPPERLDLVIPEDLIEEVGRIIGYDKIPAVQLPPFTGKVEINKNFYAAERIREYLIEKGFSEVYTSIFTEKGERTVLNKVDGVRPYLRSNLAEGLKDVLEKNIRTKELLAIGQTKIFEIGIVWRQGKEFIAVGLAVELMKKKPDAYFFLKELAKSFNLPLNLEAAAVPALDISLTDLIKNIEFPKQYDNLPLSEAVRYQSFSKYPYIVRDIAMWVPSGTEELAILREIQKEAGTLVVWLGLFDKFEKEGKTSLAYRLIFQSFERTLTEVEVNIIMEKIYAAAKAKGFEIR